MGMNIDKRPSDFSDDDSVNHADLKELSDGTVTPVPSPGCSTRLALVPADQTEDQASRSIRSRQTTNNNNVNANPLLKYIVCGSCPSGVSCGNTRPVTPC